MTRDPKADVLDAIRSTDQLIRVAEQDAGHGDTDEYIADLKRHREKLESLLAKCEKN